MPVGVETRSAVVGDSELEAPDSDDLIEDGLIDRAVAFVGDFNGVRTEQIAQPEPRRTRRRQFRLSCFQVRFLLAGSSASCLSLVPAHSAMVSLLLPWRLRFRRGLRVNPEGCCGRRRCSVSPLRAFQNFRPCSKKEAQSRRSRPRFKEAVRMFLANWRSSASQSRLTTTPRGSIPVLCKRIGKG